MLRLEDAPAGIADAAADLYYPKGGAPTVPITAAARIGDGE